MSKRSMTTILTVGNDWRIDTDGVLNLVIMHRITTKARKGTESREKWVEAGAYGTLESACRQLVQKMVIARGHADPGDASLNGLAEMVTEARAEIVQAVRESQR